MKIEITNSRQIELIDANNFSSFVSNNKILALWKSDIFFLYNSGLLKADIVKITEPTKEVGFELIHQDQKYVYLDNRVIKYNSENTKNQKNDKQIDDVELLFHPFKSYLIYQISNLLRTRIHPLSALISEKGFMVLNENYIKRLTKIFKDKRILDKIEYWDDVCKLCIISEQVFHNTIFNVYSYDENHNFSSLKKELENQKKLLKKIFKNIGMKIIENIRRELIIASEILDPNKNLHLIIRLMSKNFRNKLEGRIASAMTFFYMAESLRRGCEYTFKTDLKEEDELGFGVVFSDTKELIQGSKRVLDGEHSISKSFLRRFGLDFGVKVNVYVEGHTEEDALNYFFQENILVTVFNLEGHAIFKKKLSFLDNLKNDIKAQTFSIIVFDKDVSINIAKVREAAEKDEMFGRFFISKTDFEFESFTSEELAKIIFNISKEKGVEEIQLQDLEKDIEGIDCSNELQKTINKQYPSLREIVKKKNLWGIELAKYAMSYQKSPKFGDNNDRLINQIISSIQGLLFSNYSYVRKIYKVNSVSGVLEEQKDEN